MNPSHVFLYYLSAKSFVSKIREQRFSREIRHPTHILSPSSNRWALFGDAIPFSRTRETISRGENIVEDFIFLKYVIFMVYRIFENCPEKNTS